MLILFDMFYNICFFAKQNNNNCNMKRNIRQYDEEILKMYNEGFSSTYIANYFGVSKPGVIDRLRKYNVIKHTKTKNMITVGYSLKKYDSQIIELYNDGYSMEHIGKMLGLNRASVYYRLLVNNVSRRKIKGIKHSQRDPIITLDFFMSKLKAEKENFDYFLGIFASDGNVINNMVRISGIADENVEFLEHWCSYLDNKVYIHRRLRPDKKNYYNEVCFKNQDIVDLLSKEYGITPNKTFTVKLPYINWNVIRGVFDGDGCLVKDKRCNSWKFEIVSASEQFAYQLYDFYKEECLHPHIYKEHHLYKITILQRKDIHQIFIKLYKDCSYYLKRKYDKFLPVIQETE